MARIQNIVFDMAHVMVDFDPYQVMEHYGCTEEEKKILYDNIFDTQDWVLMDLGLLSDEEALANIKRKLPFTLRDIGARCFIYWEMYNIRPKKGMKEIIQRLHRAQYRLYLLSNAHAKLSKIWRRVIPYSVYFSGALFSGEVHYFKPQHEFYNLFYEKFDVRPEECFFIDDQEINIQEAARTGMDGYCFHDGNAETLAAELKKRGLLTDSAE
jgi:putative hydrolase of the HAD superfamily